MSAPRVLTYREHQYVDVFRYLIRMGGAGATRRELAAVLGRADQCASMRTVAAVMDEMVAAGYVWSRVSAGEPRSPWRYYAPRETWSKG